MIQARCNVLSRLWLSNEWWLPAAPQQQCTPKSVQTVHMYCLLSSGQTIMQPTQHHVCLHWLKDLLCAFAACSADIIIFGTSGPTPPTPSPSPPTPPTPPSPGPVPSPPVGCVDTYAACPGWGPGQCGTPGVATYCPCMCRGSTGPVPPGPTPPPPTGCNDNRADCTAWGPGLCTTPGVAQTCPCMCGLSG